MPLVLKTVAKGLNTNHFRKISLSLFWAVVLLNWPSVSFAGLSPLRTKFAEFPPAGLKRAPILPTPNEDIFKEDYLGYAARTDGNETYGMPGWTRNFGRRFHKGVDIVPTKWTTTDDKIEIEYASSKTRRSRSQYYTRLENVRIPQDEIYAILDGKVVVENTDSSRSGYGKYVMLEHLWADGTRFISMYAHLARIDVDEGDFVKQGTRLGIMGQTSSNSGDRRFLKAIPHMHFEVGRVIDEDFASTETSRRLNPKNFSGKYDPRNIQPYNPLEFLKKFRAITYTEFQERMKRLADNEKKQESSVRTFFPSAKRRV